MVVVARLCLSVKIQTEVDRCVYPYIRLMKLPDQLVALIPLLCMQHFNRHIYTLNTGSRPNKSKRIDLGSSQGATEIKGRSEGAHYCAETDTLTCNKRQAFLLNQDKLRCSGVITNSL